jgi:acetyl esterase/lipase
MFARVDEAEMNAAGIANKHLNVRYGAESRQAMDIYLPDGAPAPYPTVVFLHGGGWAAGSRADKQLAPFLHGVERGYAVVSVGYRLTPKVRYPENLFDVRRALRHLAANAETYGVDSSRVAIAGASAGAHLALMAAFTAGVPAFDDEPAAQTCTLRAVVDQFGPTDFLASDAQFAESDYPRDAPTPQGELSGAERMFGASFEASPNLVRFLNPIDNVHPRVPPVLLLHGRFDPVVPYQQSTALAERIRAVTGDASRAELEISPTFLHADPGYAEPQSVARIFAFLDKHLK